ncbi:hypothetical protein VPH35_124050 [Triticum aestivum]
MALADLGVPWPPPDLLLVAEAPSAWNVGGAPHARRRLWEAPSLVGKAAARANRPASQGAAAEGACVVWGKEIRDKMGCWPGGERDKIGQNLEFLRVSRATCPAWLEISGPGPNLRRHFFHRKKTTTDNLTAKKLIPTHSMSTNRLALSMDTPKI